MPKAAPSRPSLPTSSTDFALPPSSSSTSSGDDFNPLLQRFRRPSLLAPKASYLTEARLNSPLATSFTNDSSPSRRTPSNGNGSASDREMYTDSSPSTSTSSGNPTPPLGCTADNSEDERDKALTSLPSTPPRRMSSDSRESSLKTHMRRFSHPLKTPRIQNLLAESRPEEDEVKSEAAFQRLVTSGSEVPMQPKTPASDRGRYPEEAGQEESQREDTPSDDEQEDEETTFAFNANGSGSEPINIIRRHTPANSANGDEGMLISESPNSVMMDIDMPSASPSLSNLASLPTPNQWRYTPPPTANSAVRTNKRKFDSTSNDRFDPYPSSKRRAVSPSISMSYLRDAHSSTSSLILNTRPVNRLPVAIPVSVPGSAVSSAASSPTVTACAFPRPLNITSSPTMRPALGLASPILRPGTRAMRRVDGEEREVDGTGDAVGGLSLGA